MRKNQSKESVLLIGLHRDSEQGKFNELMKFRKEQDHVVHIPKYPSEIFLFKKEERMN
ncbi:hypothetical protein [Bacillus cereus group sp. BfR-BA-01494]|jgi:hypothetical protein|uniref:hypothetical protein n=1 Tax=Bacillus cereus group sp. BfR-BA-01494 TaxID=2920362 RepID=UPI001F5656F4